MAVSFQYNHYGLLNRWASRMSESPWRFNQFEDNTVSSRTSGRAYFQKHREALAEALGSAFGTATYYIGYFPQPTFVENYVIRFNDRYRWWDQPLRIPQRKLIGFGKAKYSEETLTPTYEVIEKTDTTFVPGYQVSITLPDDLAEEDKTYTKLRERYRFFLKPTSGYERSIVDQENLLLTHTYPLIKQDGDGTKYSFIIPAWELVNYKDRFDDWQENSEATLEYVASATWGNDNVPVSDSDSVQLKEYMLDDTDAVQLLSLPSSTSSDSATVKTSIDAIITNPEKGEFRLKEDQINSLTAYPYGVQVSYLSGMPLLPSGNMDARLEQAIIALANTKIDHISLPVSTNARGIYDDDRAKIYDEEYKVDREYVNPLGMQYGHFVAWQSFLEKADRVTGGVYR